MSLFKSTHSFSSYMNEQLMSETYEVPACIGSGYCCKKALCAIAIIKYGYTEKPPCPSLLHDKEKDRYVCGEYVNAPTPERRKEIERELAIGAGCCSSLNSDRIPILRKLAEQGIAKPMVKAEWKEHDTSTIYPPTDPTMTRTSSNIGGNYG